jgi:integrase
LSAERSKNRRKHEMPLSSQTWELIQAQPRFIDCPYVFSTDGKNPISGWDKAKIRISAKAGIAADSWRLHDLRRTCASGMQRLGISVPVVERALNHQSGVFRGIISTYQTYDYFDEVRVGLQRWADRVEEIVGGKPAKVVQLRGKRR